MLIEVSDGESDALSIGDGNSLWRTIIKRIARLAAADAQAIGCAFCYSRAR